MKRILYLFFLIYIVGDISHGLYIDGVDILNMTEQQSLIEWLIRVLRDVGISVAVSMAIIFSISSYSKTTGTFTSKIRIILSVSLCVVLIVISGYSYYTSNEIRLSLKGSLLERPDFISTYEEQVSSNARSLSDRMAISKSVASGVYIETGVVINVITEENVLAPYKPTPDDVREYEQFLLVMKSLSDTMESFRRAAIGWLLVLIVSVWIGVVVGKRRSNLGQTTV